MKRIMILLAVTAVAVLVFAPTAMALDPAPALQPQPGFNQPKIEPMPGSAYGPSPAYDPKNKAAADGGTEPAPTVTPPAPEQDNTPPAFDPQEGVNVPDYSGPYGSPSIPDGEGSETASSTTTPTATASTLPDTGGPSFALPVTLAVISALVISGFTALRLVLRRSATS